MKIILSVTLLIESLLSIQVWADVPNYDTSTRIISFPKVTFDSKDTYIDTQLRLNQDGSWDLLAIEAEPPLNLTGGNWSGKLYGLGSPDWSPPVLCGHIDTAISFIQNGPKLTGEAVFSGSFMCFTSSGDAGILEGEVNGRSITFTIAFKSQLEISLRGAISDDGHTLVGVGYFESLRAEGPWTLSLQNNP